MHEAIKAIALTFIKHLATEKPEVIYKHLFCFLIPT